MTDILAIIQGIGTIVAVLISIFGLYKVAKMAKREVKQADKNLAKTDVETGSEAIDATGNALKIANDAASQVVEVRKQMHDMKVKFEREIDGLRMEIDEWKYQTECERAEKEHVKQWADELVHQIVVECGRTPKKMKPFIVPERA